MLADMDSDEDSMLNRQQSNKMDESTSTSEYVDPLHRFAALRLRRILDADSTLRVRVVDVRVIGSANTRRSFLQRLLEPITQANEPGSLKKALDDVALATQRLAHFDIYESIDVVLDEKDSSSSEAVNLEAIVRLKERSRMWLRTGTDFGNQEGNAYASANFRNIFGGAESLEGNISFGTRTKASYEVKFASPVNADPDKLIEIVGYGTSRLNSYASHTENIQGAIARFKQVRSGLLQEFAVHAADRQITNIARGASLAVRQCAGMSRKISIVHTLTRDMRDNSLIPTRGYKIRTTQELASDAILGANASFLKVELDGSQHIPVSKDARTILNLSFKSGILFNQQKGRASYLSDKFQLGGPQSVRGFMYNGLGPRSGQDSLGGEVYLATGLSLLSPVPGAPAHWPVRMHSFVNGGSLLDLIKSDPLQSLKNLISQQSVSAGIGLAFQHPAARIEVNFCLPMISRSSDRTRKGLQFGLGVDFM